jgi:hypothetical protein
MAAFRYAPTLDSKWLFAAINTRRRDAGHLPLARRRETKTPATAQVRAIIRGIGGSGRNARLAKAAPIVVWVALRPRGAAQVALSSASGGEGSTDNRRR